MCAKLGAALAKISINQLRKEGCASIGACATKRKYTVLRLYLLTANLVSEISPGLLLMGEI